MDEINDIVKSKISYKHLIIFDGDCGLCNFLVRFILKRNNNKFSFASLQSDVGQAFLIQKGLLTKEFSSIIYVRGDRFYDKSTAGLMVCKDMGGIWWLFYMFIVLPKPFRDWLYSVVAKNRFRFFSKQTCSIFPSHDSGEQSASINSHDQLRLYKKINFVQNN